MSSPPKTRVTIVDYGLGNLFSVQQACEHAGMRTVITSSHREIKKADAVILPGVGAFGDAMATLARLDLVGALVDVAASSKPLVGICLGMQLLMTESNEFGHHRGLGIIEGEVVRLETSADDAGVNKVPQVGWNRIYPAGADADRDDFKAAGTPWKAPLLGGVADGGYMYFVHSYYPKPVDPEVVVSTTSYGSVEFCSSLRSGFVFGCQFHPERSGWEGMRVYRNLAKLISYT